MEKKENVEAELRELLRKEARWQAIKESRWLVVIPLLIGITFVGSLYYSRFNGIAWWGLGIAIGFPLVTFAGLHIEGLQQNKVEKLAEEAEQIDTESILALAENWHAAGLINLFFVRRFEMGLPVSFEMFVGRQFGAMSDADWQNARVLERDIREIFAELYRVHQVLAPTPQSRRNNVLLIITVAVIMGLLLFPLRNVPGGQLIPALITVGAFQLARLFDLSARRKRVDPGIYHSIRTKVFALPYDIRRHMTSLDTFNKYMPSEILNEEASAAHQ
ncbi:MAG: hypothetical protein R2688_05000 [Fimbriimonadaceae bacterium]